LEKLGEMLLVHLKSYEGGGTVHQMSGFNRQYFVAVMERRNIGLGQLPGREPEYGDKQPDVTRRTLEAWNCLERQGLLMRNPDSRRPKKVTLRAGSWRVVGFLARTALHTSDRGKPN